MSGECPVHCPIMSDLLSDLLSDLSDLLSGVSGPFWTLPCVKLSGHVRFSVRSCPVMSGHVRSCPMRSDAVRCGQDAVRCCPVLTPVLALSGAYPVLSGLVQRPY